MFSIYSFIAIALFFLSISTISQDQLRKKTKRTFVFMLIVMALIEGLRWEIGTDWENYYSAFMQLSEDVHMDFGYILLNRIVYYIYPNYSLFVFLFAITTYFVIGKTIIKYSPVPFVSLCLYYCMMTGYLGCNRQILAMLICLLSIKYVLQRDLYIFLLFIMMAMSCHITAIMFVPVYFIPNVKFRTKTIIIIVLSCFFVGVTKLVNRLPFVEYLAIIDSASGSSSFSSYLDQDFTGVSILGSLKRVFFTCLFLTLLKSSRMKLANVEMSTFKFFLYAYIYGNCIYLVFNGSSLQLLAGRGTMYFNIFEIILVPYLLKYNNFFTSVKDRKLVWLAFFILAFYFLQRDMNYYYLMDGIDIFRPYRSIFS